MKRNEGVVRMNNAQTFCCKGKRLANYLIDHNCRIIRIDCDQKSKGFLVFIFEKNKQLSDTLQSWETDKATYLF